MRSHSTAAPPSIRRVRDHHPHAMVAAVRRSPGMRGSQAMLTTSCKRWAMPCQRNGRAVARATRGPAQKDAATVLAVNVAALTATPASHADAFDTVEKQVGSVVESLRAAAGVASQLVDSGKAAVDQALPFVKQGVDNAVPIVQKGIEYATPIVKEGVRISEPAVKDATKEASKLLQEQGLDVGAVVKGAKQGADTVVTVGKEAYTASKPATTKFVEFVTTTEPTLLIEYTLGALALYYLAPPLVSVVSAAARGYKGDASAAQVLDWISEDGNTVLIDARKKQEKEAMGIPDVGGAAGRRIIEVPLYTTDKNVRTLLRDPDAVERQITALKIGALKGVSKGKRVVIMDKDGRLARKIAKELSKQGFKNVFVMKGGFNNGWFSARLGVRKILSVTSAEVVRGLPGSRRGGSFALPPGR